MLFAEKDGNIIEATPKSIAVCPLCEQEVTSKCGNIKIWHWAHMVKCPHETEPETEWHREWKKSALAVGGKVEVPIKNHVGIMRKADIVLNRRVIELQHSNIDVREIIARSDFYVGQKYRVDWVIDYTRNHFISIENNIIIANGNHRKTFDCLFGRLYGNIIFDIGDSVFIAKKLEVTKVYNINDFGGSCSFRYIYHGYSTRKLFLEIPYSECV